MATTSRRDRPRGVRRWRRPSPRIALMVVPALVLCGCSHWFPGPDPTDPLPPKPKCAGGTSSPFSPALVTRTFRRHGLTVHRLARDNWCGPDRAGVLSNQVDYVGNTDEAVSEREGWYTCVLYKRSQRTGFRRELNAKPNSPVGSYHGDWDLANVSCSLYPSSDERWDAQIRAFDAAMTDLATQR